MISKDNVRELIGATLYGPGREKIGKVGTVFLDDTSGEPEWATVKTGLFGHNESFVPLQGAELSNGEVSVQHSMQRVKDAPNIDVDSGHLSESEERDLYRYYGVSPAGAAAPNTETDRAAAGGTTDSAEARTGTPAATDDRSTSGVPTPAPSTGPGPGMSDRAAASDTTTSTSDLSTEDASLRDTASGYAGAEGTSPSGAAAGPGVGAAPPETGTVPPETSAGTAQPAAAADSGGTITRSEERLNVGTEQAESGRARLRKYVVTEDVTQTVPARRETVRVEHEPIPEGERSAGSSPDAFTESEHEVVLHEERPVVSKEQVPVERVRMVTETETGQAEVREQARKERIDEGLPDDAGRHSSTGGDTGTASAPGDADDSQRG